MQRLFILRGRFWKKLLRLSPLLWPAYGRSINLTVRAMRTLPVSSAEVFSEGKFHPPGMPLAVGAMVTWWGIFQYRKPPVRILELGSWQGSSAMVWARFFGDAHITCVDTWGGSDSLDMSVSPEQLFDENIKNFACRVRKIKSDTVSALAKFCNDDEMFDLIYIDASHLEYDVVADTILSWRLLKIGGVMIWDDYFWDYSPFAEHTPQPAINWFLRRYRGQYRLLYVGKQVVVEKTGEWFR